MNLDKHGGPAFPVPEQQFTGGLDGSYGMTLRDYFAAQAMQAIVSQPGWENVSDHQVASWSFSLADAMLKAREAV